MGGVLGEWDGGQDGEWAANCDALVFTATGLGADASDAALAALAARVNGAIVDWEAIDAEGRRLRRAVVQQFARVAAADARIDHAIGAFAGEVLALVGGNRSAELYRRFFPEPHEDVIDLGLDAEAPVVALVVTVLDQDDALPDVLRSHRAALRAALQAGNAALVARADALADLGRHRARMLGWLDSAQHSLRSTRRRLAEIAMERKLPSRWVDRFFG